MSELKKIAKITDSEIKKAGVQSLADRPNRSSQYGTGGLSAAELKKTFDSLASLIASRVNDLISGLGSDEAADYIKVALGEYQTLGDIIRAIESGELAKKLKVNPFASATWTLDLQSVINGIAQDIANIKENSYISEEGLEVVFSQISYNINAINSDKRYLVKLKLRIEGLFSGDYSFNIPTDEEFNSSIMPGFDGNDVFKLFDGQIIYTADIGSFYGVLALTFSTSQNTFFATLLEIVDGKLVAISYPVGVGAVLEEKIIDTKSANTVGSENTGGGASSGGSITLPDWVTDLSSPSNRQVPPTSGAVIDFIESKIGPGGSVGSCSCYDVPIQNVTWSQDYSGSGVMNSNILFTQVGNNLKKAVVHVAPPENFYCGGFPQLILNFESPFENKNASKVYMRELGLGGYDNDVRIEAYNTSISLTQLAYYYAPGNWFLDITAKTDTNEMWIMAYEMDMDGET